MYGEDAVSSQIIRMSPVSKGTFCVFTASCSLIDQSIFGLPSFSLSSVSNFSFLSLSPLYLLPLSL